MLSEKLQKTGGNNNKTLFEESCQTSEVVPDNPSQDEILPGRLFIFLQKRLVKISKTKNLKTRTYTFIKQSKLVPKTETKTNRFSKNLIKQTGLLPYNTPLKCTYPGTFIQIPQKVVGDLFEKTVRASLLG